MKKFRRFFLWFSFLFVTWVLHVYHLGVFPPPPASRLQTSSADVGKWYPKEQYGIHHLVLQGTPFERGLMAGQYTAPLLEAQEEKLFSLLESAIPSYFLRAAFRVSLMRWFWGVDRYVQPWMTDEMYGVSLSAPLRWNTYADRFTRQMAYHGLHEVAQFFVDMGSEGMGCTVFALPTAAGWVIGRNFDFEGGRIFDEEKIVKWVFPSEGNAFVSVIWAGMVGAVTGVNEHGVYVSLNSAGSTDFRRYGTPSTLVALQALQFSKNATEARQIIEDSTVFITDIFVLSDRNSAFRIEKSPRKFRTQSLTQPIVIANHLVDEAWSQDKINLFRRDKLTSLIREARGAQLLKGFSSEKDAPEQTLAFLRDKGDHLHLGNRGAIDALIATHSVVYDSGRQLFYVSQGPSLVGPFKGYDLTRSFRERQPVEVQGFPADPHVASDTFHRLKADLLKISQVEKALKGHDCQTAQKFLGAIAPFEHTSYFMAQGNVALCLGKKDAARQAFEHVLELKPPYAWQHKEIEEKLKQ